MLLGLLAGVLNRYIEPYFEGIDPSQLTGSLFGGGLTLTDLQIRPNIFEHLGIPFHVVAGKCGKLEVQYSLTKLYSEPIIVILKDLLILIQPSKAAEYNEEAAYEASLRDKMEHLAIFESVKKHVETARMRNSLNRNKRRVEDATSLFKEARQTEHVDPTYFDSWVMQIVRNIHIKIESVHVRYEDDITKPLSHFGAGVFLTSLHISTTDSCWRNTYVKDYMPESNFKVVHLKGLSVYWNTAQTPMYKDMEKAVIFANLSITPDQNRRLYHMLIHPFSTELRVQITPFPNSLHEPFSIPILRIDANIRKLSVTATDRQCRDVIMFLDTLDSLVKSLFYRKYRIQLNIDVNVPYKGNYKKWWKFAYTCILNDIQRSRRAYQWSNILEHRKKCRKYLRAYYKKIAGEASTFITDTISELERELDLFNIILHRQHAEVLFSRLSTPGSEVPDVGSTFTWLMSWLSYSYWFPPRESLSSTSDLAVNGATSLGTLENPEFSPFCLPPSDKDIIRVAVRFAENMNVFTYPEGYTSIHANIQLNIVKLQVSQVLGKIRNIVLDGILETVNLAVDLRPANEGFKAEVKLGKIDIYAEEIPNTEDSRRLSELPMPLLTTANPNSVEYFVKLTYEKNPLWSVVDHKVSVEGCALQFTYLHDSIERITDCFLIPNYEGYNFKGESVGHTPARTVLRNVAKFRNQQIQHLLKVMEERGKLEFSVCLLAPYLVLPVDSSKKGKANFVVINLGEINIVGTVVGGTICENGKCSSMF